MSENNTFVLRFIEIGGFRGFNSRISVSGRKKDAGDRECVWPSVTQVRVHVCRCVNQSRDCYRDLWLTARSLRRLNASLCAHPEKDELILFGGEFFNGKKVGFSLYACWWMCSYALELVSSWSISCHVTKTILTTLFWFGAGTRRSTR